MPKQKQEHVHTGTHRDYRSGITPAQGETSFQVVVEETDLLVVAQSDLSAEVSRIVTGLRGQIKAYMALNPAFGPSLTPVDVPESAPALIRSMADAAQLCGVGPMAAVAGTVAEFTARALMDQSPDILVENGGDIYLCSTRRRVAAILADPTGGASLGVALEQDDFPCSLCASSATIGHSLSLGRGELVVARSHNASLADAAATALCNILRSQRDLERVTARAEAFGLDGVFAQCDGKITVWGKMELVALEA
ncbi:UPF0280 family protein [Desulfovibrio ferrophilus]|uniref:ApbE family lipoprotein n=1 Tax=Desulfovibrio ferrophilus TaxID=241368 RepID=A0A2Z6AUQ8_9BACT|nr:UPF0280 family protein [Desulfovibrio ferrophilus]BBD06967.1 ApbE family lipoprotein [Desulfovibrio ferrophilus]